MPEIQERYLHLDQPREEGELRPGDVVRSIGVTDHHSHLLGRDVVVDDIFDGYGAPVVSVKNDRYDRRYWARHFRLITPVEDRCLR